MTPEIVDIIIALLVCGAALGLMLWVAIGAIIAERSQGRPPSLLFGVGVTSVLVAWFETAFTHVFGFIPLVPALVLCFGIPVVVGAFLIRYLPYLRRIVRDVPEAALVGVQVVRLLGASLIVEYFRGPLRDKGGFALPAGIGDVLVGIGAIVVGSMLAKPQNQPGTPGHARARRWAVYWNFFGLADLANSVVTGLVFNVPLSPPVGLVPMGIIPLFLVPLEVLLHTASLSAFLAPYIEGKPIPPAAPAPALAA